MRISTIDGKREDMSSIVLKDVCLSYEIRTGFRSIRKAAKNFLKPAADRERQLTSMTHQALKNINLSLQDGDRVGLLGRNGAGKSTLLRVIAKVYRPTEGSVDIEGKVTPFFNRNLGFIRDATGYENIITVCLLNGFSRKKAYSMVHEIAAATELGDFLYRPIRTYSKGMRVRLAFSVIMALQSEILLIDETLGGGDAKFLKRAAVKVDTMLAKSNIFVMSSHSDKTIRQFCNKGLLLESGEVRYFGDVETALEMCEAIQA